MLILFLRAILLYCFILFILRMTGKRQVSDLQPFDLLITLTIADLASCAIADTSIPLLYSIVPILALYFVQQAIARLCLVFRPFRNMICGSPLILVRDGVLQERMMREANYTVLDLCDQLRSKNIFDLGEVSYAILEANGSLSVLEKGKDPEEAKGLPYMLLLDGRFCRGAMASLGVSESWIRSKLSQTGVRSCRSVFYMQLLPDGSLRMQLKKKHGSAVYTLKGDAKPCS